MTSTPPVRVLHFVSGGFSGATQVAVDLVRSASQCTAVKPLLVLRRKRQTPASRIEELKAQGIPVQTVTGIAHALTIWQLKKICAEFKPDVLVAHGFSEHLMGRYAGLLAGVPTLIHVEHNSRERYTRWKLVQARWLAERTAHIVGVSDGVKERLIELGFPAGKVISIPNGIDLRRFQDADQHPYASRDANIVMCARFAAQKDHTTALHALALLKQSGHTPQLIFAGGGKKRYRDKAEALSRQLGLSDQVKFIGQCDDVPALLMRNQIALLSTHYEGMPLSLIEGMAAGCALVGSDVIGVRELINHGQNGLLVAHQQPKDLASALQQLLTRTDFAAQMAQIARQDASQKFDVELMRQRYQSLFLATSLNLPK